MKKESKWKAVTDITAGVLCAMWVALICATILLFAGCGNASQTSSAQATDDIVNQANPEQVAYKIDDEIDQPVLNSVVNHPIVGDERNFMFVQEIPEDSQLDFHLTHDNEPVKIEPGKTYCVLIFLRNDATFTTQTDKERLAGPPLDVLVNIPDTIDSGQNDYLLCAIRRSALLTEEYDDLPDINTAGCNVELCADEPVKLSYDIQGELKIRLGEGYKDTISNEYYVYTPEGQKASMRSVLTSVLTMGFYPSEEGSFLVWSFYADSAK